MRIALAAAAACLTLVGPLAATACLALFGLAYAARSPDRLLDVAYAALFCAVGSMVG